MKHCFKIFVFILALSNINAQTTLKNTITILDFEGRGEVANA
jgi:hypothetical protein